MALVEVMKVGSIFVDGLRAFLVLAWNSKTHVSPADRVSSRVKLLDALCKRRVLWVACQNSGLIEMLTTVLDALDLDTNLNASLFEVRMGSDAHRLSRSNLTPRPDEIVLFLIHGHSLVNVGLHQLILWILIRHRHAFVTALARVSDAFDSLLLRVGIYVDLGSSKGRV